MNSIVRQFLKNAATSWAGMAIGVTITFFFTPYLIGTLGKERYGVWALAFSIMAYMRLADVGMGQATVRYISKHLADRDWKQLNEVLSSSARLYLIVAAATLGLSTVTAFGVLHLLRIPADMFRTAQAVVMILGIRQTVMFASLPFVSLGAFHRFDIVNYFDISANILQTALMVVLLELGFGLVAMALLILVLDSTSFYWRHWLRRRMFPEVHFSRTAVSPEKTKALLGYGLYSFLLMIAWTVILQTDNVVIAGFISTEAVALFSVPAMMAIQLRSTVRAITVPLIPTVSHFEAIHDYGMIERLFARSTRYLYYVATYFCVSVLMFGGPFILLWVGPDFASSASVLYILIVGVTFALPLLVANSVLLGISRHKVAFALVGSEALANIILSVILVRSMGIVGVALGTAIPQLILYILIYPVVFHRVLHASVGAFYRRSLRSLLLAGLLLTPTAYGLRLLLPPSSWPALIADCVVVTLVMLIGLYRFILSPDDRERVVDRLRRSRPQGRSA